MWTRAAVLAAGLAVVMGCDDETTAPPLESSESLQLSVVHGDRQTGEPGEFLREHLTIAVLDASGEPMADLEVVWSVTRGGGMITPARSLTDATGVASASWKLGMANGDHGAEALIPSAPQLRARFIASARCGSRDGDPDRRSAAASLVPANGC